ncbi:MAG: hypothetical protein HDR29_07250, partial [Lachnospiraceae bacterium]|nr:hypothetical protein [Lachnospiraceae bacterium]
MNETKLTVMERISDTITEAGARIAVKATNALGKLMTKKTGKVLVTLPLALSACTITAYAANDADSMLAEIETILKDWIPKLGMMLVAVGGIQLAIGFKDDDTTGKTRGMQTIVGGA